MELLRGLHFDVVPSTFEENLDKRQFPTPEHYVIENAKQKALEVLQRLTAQGTTVDLVIGCDTVVSHEGRILEKPKVASDEEDAFSMLTSLSNAKHDVFSGVALCFSPSNVVHVFCEHTTVQFIPLDATTIREPMDKAGSYGLQGRAKAFVSAVDGCPNSVIGFPVDRFCLEVAPFLT
ncbi:hypothetical protein DYB30_004271 [Aphanomyces astaci]|uniref:Septum formation protein Maf n=1 Tax=Aphanomyces astaci TaxID=112090 RepID=A0A397BNC0_APHAT|nr:hypothetical protein DYB36_000314 [Aphanomyces astaci]RHY55347.1 hypothetical protein DYB34_000152 [Aphanomyces astaci]RHY62281.1 hypothetical protein DYB30_004271 [Aphanomyces astaci]